MLLLLLMQLQLGSAVAATAADAAWRFERFWGDHGRWNDAGVTAISGAMMMMRMRIERMRMKRMTIWLLMRSQRRRRRAVKQTRRRRHLLDGGVEGMFGGCRGDVWRLVERMHEDVGDIATRLET